MYLGFILNSEEMTKTHWSSYGQLIYRRCDLLKNDSSKKNGWNFAAQMILSKGCRVDLNWWIMNSAERKVNKPQLVELVNYQTGQPQVVTGLRLRQENT